MMMRDVSREIINIIIMSRTSRNVPFVSTHKQRKFRSAYAAAILTVAVRRNIQLVVSSGSVSG